MMDSEVRKAQRRRSSYDMHLRRNSGLTIHDVVDATTPNDNSLIREDLKELGVFVDTKCIDRMKSLGIDRTFAVANHAADIMKQRRRASSVAHKSKTEYDPPESNPYYHYPTTPIKSSDKDQINNQIGEPSVNVGDYEIRSLSPKRQSIRMSAISPNRPSTIISRDNPYDDTKLNISDVSRKKSISPSHKNNIKVNESKGVSFPIPSGDQEESTIAYSYDGPTYPVMTNKGMTYLGAPPILSNNRNIVYDISTRVDEPVVANTQRVLNILHNMNSMECNIYPPIRVAIEKLLQHLKIQYSRAPVRFVRRLLGLPDTKRPIIRSSSHVHGNQSSSRNSPGKAIYISSDQQINDIKSIIHNKRYVTLDIFISMIHNVRPEQEPKPIKELFNLLAEKRDLVDPNTVNTKGLLKIMPRVTSPIKIKDVKPNENKQRSMLILDMWAFLTLLKTVADEARCEFNLKSSKLQHMLNYWDRSEKVFDRNRSFCETQGNNDDDEDKPSTISTDSLTINNNRYKTTFTQTNMSSTSLIPVAMNDKAIETVNDELMNGVPSIDDIGHTRVSSQSNRFNYGRKSYLHPENMRAKHQNQLEQKIQRRMSDDVMFHYHDPLNDTVESKYRRNSERRKLHETSTMSVSDVINGDVSQSMPLSSSNQGNTNSLTSPLRKRYYHNDGLNSIVSDRHPSVINGLGTAIAFGNIEFANKLISSAAITKNNPTKQSDINKDRKFYRQNSISRERSVYTPMSNIINSS